MAEGLQLTLLGNPEVLHDGLRVTNLRSRKALALLCYLAVTGRPHLRPILVGLLWGEMPEANAQNNLSKALTHLRQVVGQHLRITRQEVAFDREKPYWLDVEVFEQGASALADIEQLQRAVELYRGDFLEGFYVHHSPAFEEWVLTQRARLRELALQALHTLAVHHIQRGPAGYEAAREYTIRLLALEPWREEAHRQMMLLLAASGQRSAALAQYETCRHVLAEELGVEPSPEIRETYELLLKGERPPGIPLAPAVWGREPRPVGECPYRGLAAFREEDAPFFFGREGFTERLHQAVEERPLVAVIVGSSGSGKSSAVFAGLLPRLRAGGDAGDWLIADFRPGTRPFRALAGSLVAAMSPELDGAERLVQARKLGDALLGGDLRLADAVERALQNQPRARRLLLVADQFEELYTLCSEPENRRRFLDELLAAVEAAGAEPEARFVLLLTMRADFMGRALAHRPFADALQEACVMLGPMNREELGAVVEKPAQGQGAAFEAGLVERILDDVGQEPGNLPLLEFALTLLWERQSYGWLTHAGYEEIGRVEGALARYADEVFSELDAEVQERARRVFVQLVCPGEGTEDTRRLATRAEAGEENWGLVQHLADRRLVVTGRDAAGSETVEVVHEALIQGWGQLRDWVEADRIFRTWQERLRAELRQWEMTGRDEGALLRGVPLAEAEGWLAERGGELSEAERAFIQAGMALREQRALEREAQCQRELEAARALAAEKEQVEEQARLATSRELILAAHINLQVDPERSILLALQAFSLARTTQAEEALRQAVVASRVRLTLAGLADTVRSLTYGPDGRWLATATWDGTVSVWDAANGELTLTLPGEIVAYSPDGACLATATEDGAVRTWDALSGEELLTLPGHTSALVELLFSPDGRYVASACKDETVRVWETTTGQELFSLPVRSGGWSTGSDVLFSPDGEYLITADNDWAVTVWDLASGDALQVLSGGGAPLAISPDGRLLALVTPEDVNVAVVWDLEASLAAGSGQPLFEDLDQTNVIQDMAFSPDGTRLATGGQDMTARIWTLTAEGVQESLILAGHAGMVLSLAFSPDGRSLATGGSDATARIWDISASGNQEILTLDGHFDWLRRVAYSPDGARLVTTDGDGHGVILDAESGETLLTFPHPTGAVWEATFSPDGTRLATAGEDNTARVWDALNGRELLTLTGHAEAPPVGNMVAGIPGVAFSPDGKLLASGGADGQAILWDAETGESVFALQVHPHGIGVTRVAFSPDGIRLAAASDQHPVEGDPTAGDALVAVWDTVSGQQLYTLTGLPNRAWALTFSPDSTKLVVPIMAGFVKICDAASGQESLSLPHHGGRIIAVAFSPDGTLLATGGADPPQLWDLVTGQELLTLPGHTGMVNGLAFSPDGTRLASSSLDGTTRVYTLDVDELVALARSRLTRWFTPAECRHYLHLDECPPEP